MYYISQSVFKISHLTIFFFFFFFQQSFSNAFAVVLIVCKVSFPTLPVFLQKRKLNQVGRRRAREERGGKERRSREGDRRVGVEREGGGRELSYKY